MTAERVRRYRLGRFAEILCAWHLRVRGYRVLARRFRSPAGEIDLVARRGRIIAFIEVKARPDRDQALAAVTPRQRARILRAAQMFVAHRPQLAECDFRFDVMLVTPGRLPAHVIDAWRD
jgi:putative endonuclease